jgi:hypothetical protein
LARLGIGLAATGAGVGAASVVGPAGALITPIVRTTLDEVLNRALTNRQQARVVTAATEASKIIEEQRAEGNHVRSDDFFRARDGRWSANEVAEAVPYLGHLLAMVATEREIDVQTAHWLVKIAEDLTWTQYQQLAIVARIDELEVPDIQIEASGASSWSARNAMLQLEDLGWGKRELILGKLRPGDEKLAVGPINRRLREQELNGNGLILNWALGLHRIPDEVLQEHLALLAGGTPAA